VKVQVSLQIVTKRSNVFPATLLVGLSVIAVALAFATAAVPVEVYCVCASDAPTQSEKETIDHILILSDSKFNGEEKKLHLHVEITYG
jgi:hypothetical protein